MTAPPMILIPHSQKATKYEPVARYSHSTVRVGDCLYMWGGTQPYLPDEHDNEMKKSLLSVMEVCHLEESGRWEQKPTTGSPPLGVKGYASAVIGREIFFFGGECGHYQCHHNSLYSFNVDTFNWKDLSPTSPHHGPMMKGSCGMVAVQFDGEDYLVVIGGSNDGNGQQPGTQCGAQYESNNDYQYCNEIHYYKLSSGEWISPTVTGDRPPPICLFTLTSVTNNSAILFGGSTNECSYKMYIIDFTKTSVDMSELPKVLPNPGALVQWPKGRLGHSTVFIDTSIGPHLLMVGGYNYGATNDCWLFDINKKIWKQLFSIPDTVIGRYYHSLSVWSVAPTTYWIIVFGGKGQSIWSLLSDTRILELRYTSNNDWFTSEIPLDQYQEKLQERRREGEELTGSEVTEAGREILDIKDLADIIEKLKAQQFDYTKWSELGLYLGLYYEPTLKAIDVHRRGNSMECLMDCLSAWLKKEDAVKDKGCPSWLTLATALKKLEKSHNTPTIKGK